MKSTKKKKKQKLIAYAQAKQVMEWIYKLDLMEETPYHDSHKIMEHSEPMTLAN